MILNQNVTCCKVLAIILMVLGHCCGPAIPYCTQIIYMFHMPLFFFVSGFCFKEKYLTDPESFVVRRFKGLWWPFVKWSLVFLCFHNLFVKIGFYAGQDEGQSGDGLYHRDDIIIRFLDIIFDMSGNEQLLGGYWFLHAMLGGVIIAFLFMYIGAKVKNFNTKIVSYVVDVLIVGILLILLMLTNEYIRRYMGIIYPRTLLAAICFFIGRLFSAYDMRKFNWWESAIAFSLVVYGSFYWRLEPASYFFDGMTLQIPLYIFTAILGTWVIYSLPWHLVKETSVSSKIINYIDANTLTILTWHFLCFKLVSYIIILVYHLPDYYLTMFPTIPEYSDKGWWIAYFLIGVTLPLLISFISEKISATLKINIKLSRK